MYRNPCTLLTALVLSLLVAPCWTKAQQPGKVRRIGLFHVGLDHVPPALDLLRDGLKALGYEEGKNLILDWRNLPDDTAKAFVRERVDLIVALTRRHAPPRPPQRQSPSSLWA